MLVAKYELSLNMLKSFYNLYSFSTAVLIYTWNVQDNIFPIVTLLSHLISNYLCISREIETNKWHNKIDKVYNKKLNNFFIKVKTLIILVHVPQP